MSSPNFCLQPAKRIGLCGLLFCILLSWPISAFGLLVADEEAPVLSNAHASLKVDDNGLSQVVLSVATEESFHSFQWFAFLGELRDVQVSSGFINARAHGTPTINFELVTSVEGECRNAQAGSILIDDSDTTGDEDDENQGNSGIAQANYSGPSLLSHRLVRIDLSGIQSVVEFEALLNNASVTEDLAALSNGNKLLLQELYARSKSQETPKSLIILHAENTNQEFRTLPSITYRQDISMRQGMFTLPMSAPENIDNQTQIEFVTLSSSGMGPLTTNSVIAEPNLAHLDWYNPIPSYNTLKNTIFAEDNRRVWIDESPESVVDFQARLNRDQLAQVLATLRGDVASLSPEAFWEILSTELDVNDFELALREAFTPDFSSLNAFLSSSSVDESKLLALLDEIERVIMDPIAEFTNSLNNGFRLQKWSSRGVNVEPSDEPTSDTSWIFVDGVLSNTTFATSQCEKTIVCNDGVTQSEASWRAILPQGGVLLGVGDEEWPDFNTAMPLLIRESEVNEEGVLQVTKDRRDEIERALVQHNESLSQHLNSLGGCAQSRSYSSWGLFAVLFLRLSSRRKRSGQK